MVRSDGDDRRFHLFCESVAPPNTVLWGRDSILSRRPFWRLAHIQNKVRPGQGPGVQQKKSGTDCPIFHAGPETRTNVYFMAA
jgi:hypothetical protein